MTNFTTNAPDVSFGSDRTSGQVSRKRYIIGWILTILPSLLLMFSAVMKFVQPAGMDEELERIGWPMRYMGVIGAVELICTIVFLIPRTSVLGAILLTGYVGGAIATHARIGEASLATGIILGIVIWLAVFLREPRLHALIPLRSK
jgi:hypothetical protein